MSVRSVAAAGLLVALAVLAVSGVDARWHPQKPHPTPRPTPTRTATPAPSPSPTLTPTPSPIATATPPAPTPTPTASATATPTPTAVPTPTPFPSIAASPSSSAYSLDMEFDAPDARLVPEWAPTDPGDRLDTDQEHDVTITQSTVAGGILTMNVERKATPAGRPFAGAAWSTYGTFAQRYGTFETRIRYDEAKGTWPGWFMLPAGQKGPYPEIDMLEAYGDTACEGPGYLTTSWSISSTVNGWLAFIPVSAPSTGWHVHKLIWTPTRLDFYIDGVNTFSVTDPAHVPQVPMYPIFTMGVGANNPGCRADATTPDLTTMQVDYLRVAQ